MNKAELHDDLAKLMGWAPHNKPNNILYGDYVYAHSLEKKYGKTIDELRKEDANGRRTGRDDQARVRKRDGRRDQGGRASPPRNDGTGATRFRDQVAAYAALVVALENFISWCASQDPKLRESYLQDYGPRPRRPVAGELQGLCPCQACRADFEAGLMPDPRFTTLFY